jgi:allophanate hydrolase
VPPSDDLDFFGDRDDDPDAMLPVTRSIIERGRHYSALDAYRAQYELAQLKREADVAFRSIDVLPLPTTGTIYEKAAVAASMPISVFIRIS